MTLDELLDGVDKLLSLPEAVIQATELLDSGTASLNEIADVISHDPALSAQLLKIVNSALYGFPGQVDTVSRAIGLIGTDELRSLIMASSATSVFNAITTKLIDMNSFWHRSVFCGLVARRLAIISGISRKGEVQFLTGLFHDIGRLVLFSQQPEKSEMILTKAQQVKCPSHELEEVLLGYNRATVGAQLLKNWQLPAAIWEPIQYQFNPQRAEEYQTETELLSLAIQVTNTLEPELKEGEPLELQRIESTTLAGKSIDQNELALVAMDANLETFEVLNIINPVATTIY